MGVIWQPSPSHNDRVYASFGRFYLQVPLNISTLWYLAYPYVESVYSDPRPPGAVADTVYDSSGPEPDYLMNLGGLEVENSDEISVGYKRCSVRRSS